MSISARLWFFRISRSRRSSRTSFRSLASSSFSSVVSVPRLLLPPSARACSTHFPSDDAVRSRSFATCVTLLPSLSTNATAPALNSSLKLRRVRCCFFGLSSFSMGHPNLLQKVSTGSGQAHYVQADAKSVYDVLYRGDDDEGDEAVCVEVGCSAGRPQQPLRGTSIGTSPPRGRPGARAKRWHRARSPPVPGSSRSRQTPRWQPTPRRRCGVAAR